MKRISWLVSGTIILVAASALVVARSARSPYYFLEDFQPKVETLDVPGGAVRKLLVFPESETGTVLSVLKKNLNAGTGYTSKRLNVGLGPTSTAQNELYLVSPPDSPAQFRSAWLMSGHFADDYLFRVAHPSEYRAAGMPSKHVCVVVVDYLPTWFEDRLNRIRNWFRA